MRPRLPSVPFEIKGRLREYISSLVERLADELDNRVERQQGVLYVTKDRPLRIVSTDGAASFDVSVTLTGELVLTPVDVNTTPGVGSPAANPATVAVTASVTP